MNILSWLKKLAVSLEKRQGNVMTYPISEQRKYIKRFPKPDSDIKRAYYQYKCQMKLYTGLVGFLLNIASLPVLLLYLFKPTEDPVFDTKTDAVFIADGKPGTIIPELLHDKYPAIARIDNKAEYFNAKDPPFVISVWKKYPLSFHFILKSIIKIRFYSYEIHSHQPDAFIVCNEYSFTSSLLTAYCHMYGIKHINVMHGEKLYFMRDSFFHFDECYVWDQRYIDLFYELGAEMSQFICAVPPSLRFSQTQNIKKEIDFTYYLAAENKDQLSTIFECLYKLSQKGYTIAVRPHPRYSNLSDIVRLTKDPIQIENCDDISIEHSVLRTSHAIAVYSTVLNQAFHNGTNVVIDDISNPEAVNRLSDRGYVILKMKHTLLSKELTK